MVVYPRWRGELFCALAFCWLSRGLSPLARGTLDQAVLFFQRRRFIPAGAGNTTGQPQRFNRNDGLSPLARGTRRQRIVRLPLHRFIPAGAGNTSTLSITTDRVTVYPRWRGEHEAISKTPAIAAGLSPLARGTLCRCQHCWRVIRFIPAGAGNTVPRIISLSSSTVYPRWRGEHPERDCQPA